MWYNIQKLLDKNGMNINEFSLKIGISSQVIYRWRNGTSKPSLEMLKKLAEYFGVSVSYFETGKLVEENENFTDDDLLLARELNRSDKVELIKDIMKIQKEKDVEIIELITKKILESQG